MTEPLSKISRIKEAGRKKSHPDNLKHEKLKRHPDEAEDDSVDISEEARNRASGKSAVTFLSTSRIRVVN